MWGFGDCGYEYCDGNCRVGSSCVSAERHRTRERERVTLCRPVIPDTPPSTDDAIDMTLDLSLSYHGPTRQGRPVEHNADPYHPGSVQEATSQQYFADPNQSFLDMLTMPYGQAYHTPETYQIPTSQFTSPHMFPHFGTSTFDQTAGPSTFHTPQVDPTQFHNNEADVSGGRYEAGRRSTSRQANRSTPEEGASSSRQRHSQPRTGGSRGQSSGLSRAPLSDTPTDNWVTRDPMPGGPQILDILIGYKSHVAATIWENQDFRLAMKVHTRSTQSEGWPLQSLRGDAVPIVERTGLHALRDMMIKTPNVGLISAFVERWHPETNSFHMPFGEMTITLHDVHYILGNQLLPAI